MSISDQIRSDGSSETLTSASTIVLRLDVVEVSGPGSDPPPRLPAVGASSQPAAVVLRLHNALVVVSGLGGMETHTTGIARKFPVHIVEQKSSSPLAVGALSAAGPAVTSA